MYQSQVSLQPRTTPESYVDAATAQAENQSVFASAWHLFGATEALKNNGDYLTNTLFGVPIVVRNFSGELVALRNVCAHRQSIIAREKQGCSPTLKCPYHGWEYGSDGKTRKLPGAQYFPKFKHDEYCLDRFQVATCGLLVFVKLTSDGPDLKTWMGEHFELYEQWFSADLYQPAMHARFEIAANWKIPIEGSLESYHIPCVHEKTFHEDPGETASDHEFFPTGSAFRTVFLAPRKRDRLLRFIERSILRFIGRPFAGGYTHHHVYPHLLISHTDSLTVAQVVYPGDTPETCFTEAVQLGIKPVKSGWIKNRVAKVWGQFTAGLTKTVLKEDQDIFPFIQQGIRGATKQGILGRCEERLHSFQADLEQKIQSVSRSQE